MADTRGENTGTSRGTTLTAPGALNTKGAWTQITDSCPDARWLLVVITTRTAAGSTLVDIGVGASGSESTIIGNLLSALPTTYGVTVAYLIRYDLSSGQRISARYARSAASVVVDVAITFLDSAADVAMTESTYGAVEASTDGTAVASGAANTKGSWVEFISSLPSDMKLLIVAAHDATGNGAPFLFDIGTGTGEPTVVIDNVPLCGRAASSPYEVTLYAFPLAIASGTRVSMRCQCSTGSAQMKAIMYACRVA